MLSYNRFNFFHLLFCSYGIIILSTTYYQVINKSLLDCMRAHSAIIAAVLDGQAVVTSKTLDHSHSDGIFFFFFSSMYQSKKPKYFRYGMYSFLFITLMDEILDARQKIPIACIMVPQFSLCFCSASPFIMSLHLSCNSINIRLIIFK